MKGIISRQITHTCSPSPKQGAFKLISRLTGLCYFIPFLDLKAFLLKSTPFPHIHRKTTRQNAFLKCQFIRGEFRKKHCTAIFLCPCVSFGIRRHERQSKPENYCVLNSPALFPKKMGAALFLGKSLGDEVAVKYCPVQIFQTQTQPRPQALLAFQGEAR